MKFSKTARRVGLSPFVAPFATAGTPQVDPLPITAKPNDKQGIPQYFTPQQIAARFELNVKTIRNLFRDEQDVLKIPGPSRKNETLRIPAHVVQQYIARLGRGRPRRGLRR